MVILELAVQAVRGFSPSARVALKAGYVALRSPSEVPSPVAGLLTALCYPDSRTSDASFLAPGAKAGRAGFSFQGANGGVWRLVRDLGGAGALYGQNRQTGQFEVVSQEAAEMSQLLRAEVGLPPRASFEQLFAFTVGQLPTRAPRGAPAKKEATQSARRKMASAMDQYDFDADKGTPEERLAALEAELKTARTVAELQFRMDGVQAETFKAEERLRALDAIRSKVDGARADLASVHSPASLGLPDDISARMLRLPDDRKRRDEQLERLQVEREEAGLSEGVSVASVFKDQRFLGAAAAGLALLIGGGLLEGGYRYLALLSIVPFSLAALLALRYVEELQFAARESSKGELFATREKKIRDEYDLAATMVQAALDKAGVETQEDFFALMAKQEALKPQLEEHERQLAELTALPENADLLTTIARLKAEHEALNGELMQLSGGYAREVRDIERDLAKLKEQLAPSPPPGEFAAVNTNPGEPLDDPTPALMLLGADLFGTDVPTLWGVLRERTVQYLTALTDRRYHAVDVDKDGHAVVQAPGRSIPAGELPGRDLDLLYLSIRLTLVEKYSAQAKVPVIFEDAFGSVIDAAKQTLFQRMLKHLGTLTQVLHVTGIGQNVPAADVVVTI